jgi:HD-GYP domain-containing protein (c-di-GMP phosphodiesterase class II)
VTIDVRSILLAECVICLAFLGLSAFTWRRGRAEVPGSGHWFMGFSCLTAGIGLVAFRGLVPDAISIVAGNAFVLAGVLLKVLGNFRYLGKRYPRLESALIGTLVASVLFLVLFEYLIPSLSARMLVISATGAAFGMVSTWILVARSPKELASHARVAAALNAAFVLVNFFRFGLALAWRQGEDWMAAGNVADSYAMVALIVILSGLAVAEMLLLHGKLEASLRSKARELLAINVELGSTQKEILLTLSEIVEFRSKETASHVARVGEYARLLSFLCGRDPGEARLIGDAAPMHDIGKISVPDSILNKVSGLEAEELAIIQRHTTDGYRLLNKSERPLVKMAAVIALEHHEQWAGRGYPAGKSGESISFAGRVVCLCDVFDALAFERPYKAPWELPRILDFIEEQRGSMFDPAIVDAFLGHLDDFLAIPATLALAEHQPAIRAS